MRAESRGYVRILTFAVLSFSLAVAASEPQNPSPYRRLCRTSEQRNCESLYTVWAAGDGEKIERDDLQHPLKRKNIVWNGRSIRLLAARNEVIAFQVVIETGSRGIKRLTASLRGLRHQSGKRTIRYRRPLRDPSNTLHRPIQLFSVHYLEVTQPTNARWIYDASSRAAPKDPVGWKPVQLIPENARAGRGGFPLSVPPQTNQSIWIEVFIHKNLPAGAYHGQLRIRGDRFVRTIPVRLKVFDFALPDENSMNAMLYFEPAQVRLYHGKDRENSYHRFAHRNRVELVYGYSPPDLAASASRFTGEAFSRSAGYEGPGDGVGNRIIPASFYGAPEVYRSRDSAWQASNEWMSLLSQWFPNALTFLYLTDEPSPQDFPDLLEVAGNIRSNPHLGRTLPTLVTRSFSSALAGAIDIWVSTGGAFRSADVMRAREGGERYWLYNGGRPHLGAVVIDAPATDPRAIIWSCFKKDIETYFYWHSVHWMHNHQKPGEKIQNVWRNPITFDNRGQPFKRPGDQGAANGDGVLLYPGEEVLHPSEDRGIQGPISTLQLANFRRGLQDHQYLSLARDRGLELDVQAALAAVVPHVLDEAGGSIGFAEGGEAYEFARIRLARAIETSEKSKRGGARRGANMPRSGSG